MADRVPLDFDPPVRQLRALLLGVADEDLTAPTPCDEWTVGDLLDHVMKLSLAFAQTAKKTNDDDSAPEPSAADLPPHWRSRTPVLLEELATAWKQPEAWTGTARAGGVTMPAADLGVVAMNELVMHSWDLSQATGQDFAADPRILEALIEFLGKGQVTADDEASLLDQALRLAGRDPNWFRTGRRRRLGFGAEKNEGAQRRRSA